MSKPINLNEEDIQQLLLRALAPEGYQAAGALVLFKYHSGGDVFHPGDGLTVKIMTKRHGLHTVKDLNQNEIVDYMFRRLTDEGYDVQTGGISFTFEPWTGSRLLTDDGGSVEVDGIGVTSEKWSGVTAHVKLAVAGEDLDPRCTCTME